MHCTTTLYKGHVHLLLVITDHPDSSVHHHLQTLGQAPVNILNTHHDCFLPHTRQFNIHLILLPHSMLHIPFSFLQQKSEE